MNTKESTRRKKTYFCQETICHGMASPPSFFVSFPLPSLVPSFCSSPTPSDALTCPPPPSTPTPRHAPMTPCYVHSWTSLRLMPDLLRPGSHAKGYLLYTFNTFI